MVASATNIRSLLLLLELAATCSSRRSTLESLSYATSYKRSLSVSAAPGADTPCAADPLCAHRILWSPCGARFSPGLVGLQVAAAVRVNR